MNMDATNPWPRRAALSAALLTAPILLIGGTVTTLRVGMAVPDWPTTFQQNMFTYPLSEMLKDAGVFWEHSHRLWGALVGLAVLATCVLTLACEPSRRLKALSVVALVAVVGQGLLGGKRLAQVTLQGRKMDVRCYAGESADECAIRCALPAPLCAMGGKRDRSVVSGICGKWDLR